MHTHVFNSSFSLELPNVGRKKFLFQSLLQENFIISKLQNINLLVQVIQKNDKEENEKGEKYLRDQHICVTN